MRHTLICPQFGGQVDQLGGEIWEDAQKGQSSNADTDVKGRLSGEVKTTSSYLQCFW